MVCHSCHWCSPLYMATSRGACTPGPLRRDWWIRRKRLSWALDKNIDETSAGYSKYHWSRICGPHGGGQSGLPDVQPPLMHWKPWLFSPPLSRTAGSCVAMVINCLHGQELLWGRQTLGVRWCLSCPYLSTEKLYAWGSRNL